MNRLATCLAVLLLGGCTHSEKVSAPVGAGKPEAPVAVEAELTASSARLTLKSETDGKDVTAVVSGVDGLTVSSEPTLLSSASLSRGEARTFEVAFRPGPGQSLLVVSVQGTFGGARRGRVLSFAVGTPTEAQRRGAGTVITTDDGQRLNLMPSGH
jgi:hypothetical protein